MTNSQAVASTRAYRIELISCIIEQGNFNKVVREATSDKDVDDLFLTAIEQAVNNGDISKVVETLELYSVFDAIECSSSIK